MRTIIATITIMLGMVGMGEGSKPSTDAGTKHGASIVVVTEDESAWDCRTMGNHVCGAEHQGLR